MGSKQWGHGYYNGLDDGYQKGISDGYKQGAIDGFNYGYDSSSKKSTGDFLEGAAIATAIVGGIAAIVSGLSSNKKGGNK